MFLRVGASPNINIHWTPRFCDFLGAHVTSSALDSCYQRYLLPTFGLCPESAVPHSSLLIVKNSAERSSSVSPCQARSRGKMRRPVRSLLFMTHYTWVLSTRTRAGPFSLHAYL